MSIVYVNDIVMRGHDFPTYKSLDTALRVGANDDRTDSYFIESSELGKDIWKVETLSWRSPQGWLGLYVSDVKELTAIKMLMAAIETAEEK